MQMRVLVPAKVAGSSRARFACAAVSCPPLLCLAAQKVEQVAPSDHVMPGTDDFHASIKVGLSHVQNQKMVTFGIKPMHPETGYGYLELAEDPIDDSGTSDLEKFIEKPDLPDAFWYWLLVEQNDAVADA